MRRMYSEKQLTKLANEAVFPDISKLTITKGTYTTDAFINVSICGKCITITGFFSVNNTSGNTIENYDAFTINNLVHSDLIDDITFPIIKNMSSLITGKIYANNKIKLDIPTGESVYSFDVDFIDNDYLPVED